MGVLMLVAVYVAISAVTGSPISSVS